MFSNNKWQLFFTQFFTKFFTTFFTTIGTVFHHVFHHRWHNCSPRFFTTFFTMLITTFSTTFFTSSFTRGVAFLDGSFSLAVTMCSCTYVNLLDKQTPFSVFFFTTSSLGCVVLWVMSGLAVSVLRGCLRRFQ